MKESEELKVIVTVHINQIIPCSSRILHNPAESSSYLDLSLCHPQQIADRISFRYLGNFYLVCIAWTFPSIFKVSLLSPISFDLFYLVPLSHFIAFVFLGSFNFVGFLYLLPDLLYFNFHPHFPSKFCISVGFLWRMPILLPASFAPISINSFTSVISVGYMFQWFIWFFGHSLQIRMIM